MDRTDSGSQHPRDLREASTSAADRSAASAVRGLIIEYLDAFNCDEFDAAADCYHLPFTWLFGPKRLLIPTRAELAAMLRETKAGLVETGLARSTLSECHVRALGDHAALASVAISRLREDGSEIERIGASYLVHDEGEGWRFHTVAAHPLTAIVR